MICTFGDTTDVVWWRELQLPTRNVMGRDGRLRRRRRPSGATADADAAARYARARGQDRRSRRRRAIVELLARVRRARRRAEADHAPGEVLRARRPPARDRHVAAVVLPQRRPRPGAARRVPRSAASELRWHPPHMRAALRVLGRGPQRRLARSAASGSSACRSRSGTALDADGERRLRRRRSLADRGPAARRPVERRARRLHRRPAGPAGRLRRRPRRDGHVGDVVAHAADRDAAGATTPTCSRRTFPMDLRPAGSRDHPHLAVRHGRARALRARHAAVDATPRSTAGSSTPTARRCRSRKGNVVTPMPLLEQYGSDAVRYWALNGRPGTDTAVDEGQMKVGRRLAIKLLNASKFALGVMGDAGDRRRAVTEPLDRVDARRRSPTSSTTSTARVRRLRLRPRARAHRAVLLGLLRRLRRAGEAARVRRRRRRAARRRPAPRSRVALVDAAAAVRAVPPFVTEEVWSWWQDGSVHRARVARRAERAAARRRRRPLGLRGRGRGARRGPQGEVRSAALAARRGRRASSSRDTRRAARPRSRASTPTCASAGSIATLEHRGRRRVRGRGRARPTNRPCVSRWSPSALAWLDAHVNLETGVGVPAGADRREHRADARPHPGARRAARVARSSRIPAVHLTGHERQDVGRPG